MNELNQEVQTVTGSMERKADGACMNLKADPSALFFDLEWKCSVKVDGHVNFIQLQDKSAVETLN